MNDAAPIKVHFNLNLNGLRYAQAEHCLISVCARIFARPNFHVPYVWISFGSDFSSFFSFSAIIYCVVCCFIFVSLHFFVVLFHFIVHWQVCSSIGVGVYVSLAVCSLCFVLFHTLRFVFFIWIAECRMHTTNTYIQFSFVRFAKCMQAQPIF